MTDDGYDASAIEMLRSLPPPRKRPKGFVTTDTLSDRAMAMPLYWEGRPDARLNAVADLAIPFMKAHDANPPTVLNELIGAGLAGMDLGGGSDRAREGGNPAYREERGDGTVRAV